jgi:hypothetical protein
MQTSDARSGGDPAATGAAELARHSLMDTFITRRSRRFALGNTLYGSGLAFQSQATPVPLSLDEEAVIAFAATGVTGHVNGELPYAPDGGPETGGGQVMMSMVGRTQSSADAVATATLAIMRDDATYLMPRPQDLPSAEFEALVVAGREHRYTEVYQRMRIRWPITGRRSRGNCLHAALQQVVNQPARGDVFRPGDRGHGALPDHPVRGPGRPVRLLLP